VQGRACGEDPVLELRLERDIADDFMRLLYGPFSERKLAAGLGSLSSSAAKLRDASDRALQGQ
jgi:X-X-X-Leu-X-X-Gly heptad repeat protein